MSRKDETANKLMSNPQLAQELDFEANDLVLLRSLTLGSSRSVAWICPVGHRYKSTPHARSKRNAGCPYCAGKKVLAGFNDLASQQPDVSGSWSVSRNQPATPETVHMGSNVKYWWECELGHEWNAAVYKRVAGQNCPICSNKTVQIGTNDLASARPSTARFWSPKNLREPTEFTAGSHESVLWICEELHEFRSPIRQQAKGFRCPFCTGSKVLPGSSDFFSKFPELRQEWDEVRNGSGPPIDISIGSRKYWWKCESGHSFETTTAHRSRGQSCPYCSNKRVLAGYNDLETTHPDLFAELSLDGVDPKSKLVSSGSDKKMSWSCPKCRQNYEASVSSRMRGTSCPICANLRVVKGINDLASTHPDLAALWDGAKNAPENAFNIVKGSNKKFFWICNLGHSFKSSPNEMGVNSCPVCSNRVVQPGVNDLATLFPELITQWSDKNPLSPSEVIPGSPKKAYWECDKGHAYSQAVNSHVFRGQGCPYCSNTRVLPGFNDLATTHAELIEEWDWGKNTISPSSITAGTNRKLWWKCASGHSWAATGNKRVNERGCPSCSAGGFDSTEAATLYWLYNANLSAMKVGITGQKKARLGNLVSAGWNLVFKWDSDQGARVRFVETHFFRWVRRELQIPRYLDQQDMGRLGGASETFSAELSQEVVRLKLQELIAIAEELNDDELIDVKITRPRLD
jgi:Zn finger protein HypA/HybF involved in hydrogenase expression